MYLNLDSKAKSEFPYLTLGVICNLASGVEKGRTFNLTCNPLECSNLKLRIDQNRSQYLSIIESAKGREEVKKLWSKKMLDIEYAEFPDSAYPESMDLALIKIRACNLDLIQSLIELFKSVGIELDYITKFSDSVAVSEYEPYCTKRLVKYFPSLAVKISRSEYNRLRKINKWLAIKSGNFYFKNKNCNL